MKVLILTFILFISGAQANAALTAQGCVQSDLAFIAELDARAASLDDSLFSDERIFRTSAQVIATYNERLQRVGGGYIGAIYSFIINLPTCDAVRALPAPSYNAFKAEVRHQLSLVWQKDEWVEVSANSPQSLKKKAFANFRKHLLDIKDVLFYRVLGKPLPDDYYRSTSLLGDTTPEFKCRQVGPDTFDNCEGESFTHYYDRK